MPVTSHAPEVKKVKLPASLSCAMCVKLSSLTTADVSVKRDEPSNEGKGGAIYKKISKLNVKNTRRMYVAPIIVLYYAILFEGKSRSAPAY